MRAFIPQAAVLTAIVALGQVLMLPPPAGAQVITSTIQAPDRYDTKLAIEVGHYNIETYMAMESKPGEYEIHMAVSLYFKDGRRMMNVHWRAYYRDDLGNTEQIYKVEDIIMIGYDFEINTYVEYYAGEIAGEILDHDMNRDVA